MAGLGTSQAPGPWVIAADERTKHETTFLSLKPMSGFLTGEQAKLFFLKSNLQPMVLGQIWSLSDIDRDGKMTMQEFTIAVHLIQNKLKGIELPSALPNTLKMTSMPSTFNRTQTGKTSSPGYSPTGHSGISNGFTKMSGTATLPKSSGISWSGISQPASSSGFVPTPVSGLGSLSSSFNVGVGGGFGTNTTGMSVLNGPGVVASTVKQQGPVGSGTDVRRSLSLTTSFAGQNSGNITSISSVARLKYNQMFKANDYNKAGYLSGEQARSLLIQSGLPQTSLAQIWNLSDVDKDGQLNLEEFVLAMHFVDMAKQGNPLPLKVPVELVTPSMQARPHSDSIGSDVRERSGSNLSLDGRSRSGSIADEKRMIFTFEDKRKQNFEKGRLELDRRRQELQEKLKKEKDDRESKERLEEDRQQRAKIEAEQRRQSELEKQRQQQLEMEREQEGLRKKMIQQRLAAQIEAERQRQLEWQKRKEEELLNQKGLEQDIVNNLKQRLKKMDEDLAIVVGKKTAVQQSFNREQQVCLEAKKTLNTVSQNKEMRVTDISRVQCDIKEYQQQLFVMSNERERNSLEMNKRDTSKLAEAHGNAMASLQDTKATIRRLQAVQSSAETGLEDRLKELDSLNTQLRDIKTSVQQLTIENTRLQQITESKQREYTVWKQQKDDEERVKKEMDAQRRKEDEETIRQKEREQEAMRLEQERQKRDQELRRRMQEAREAETRHKEQQLLTKDQIVVHQQETLAKTQTTMAWRTEALDRQDGSVGDVKNKVEHMENIMFGQKVETLKTVQKEIAVPRPRPRPIKKNLEYYRVLFPFEPRNPDEMPVEEGDLVTVDLDIVSAPPGWVRGTCKEKSGLFPANYAEEITEDEAKREQSPGAVLPPEKSQDVSVKSLVAAISHQLGGGGTLVSSNLTPATQNHGSMSEGPISGRGTPAPQGLKAVALYAYRAKKDDMLSFNKNDTIVIKEQQDMWWSGELNGKMGWFPKSYVKLVSSTVKTSGVSSNSEVTASEVPSTGATTARATTAAPQTESKESSILFECVAMYAYTGEEGDLSFVEGESISITTAEGEWWEGRLHGRSGLFPANYVKKKETETPVAAPRTKPEIATVSSPYNAITADQLSLAPGQLIRITKKDSSGWWEGELQARGKKRQSGIFPSNHVKLLTKGPTPTTTPTSSGRTTPQPDDGGIIYEVPSSLANTAQGKLDQVLAMFPYTAQKEDELTFYKGSVINVISKEGEWWKGELNGQVGVFPSNYVQSLGDLPASTTQ